MVKLCEVNLGVKKVHIPVADLEGKASGKTVLVTAGMDGDEYAGIEAAYRLIDRYKTGDFAGRLIIVPVLNTEGFAAGMSINPLDGKYPKHIYPGKLNGSASECLMHWLHTTHAVHADVWMDLHGGALTEWLTPFVWGYQSHQKEVDARLEALLFHLNAPHVILQKQQFVQTAKVLARHDCLYVMTEAGEQGKRDEESIALHVGWVEKAMEWIGMVSPRMRERSFDFAQDDKKGIYEEVHEYCASVDGLWYPEVTVGNVMKGMVLGDIRNAMGEIIKQVKSAVDGVPLWGRTVLPCKKGDILVALASKQNTRPLP